MSALAVVRGVPLLHDAVGFCFHLEPLVADDADVLAAVNDGIVGMLGDTLRWSWSSVHPEVVPFDLADLDLVSQHATALDNPEADAAPEARVALSQLAAARVDRFGFAAHGAAERNLASPISYRFYATIAPAQTGPWLESRAMLAVTMPRASEPRQLRTLATMVAERLRIRWGVAGLTYGAWEFDRHVETRDALFAHARRHPGYDVLEHATTMDAFHERLRTVGWLTFVGPALLARLPGPPRARTRDVTIEPCGAGVVLIAGDAPQAGDVNRRDLPRPYAEVDAILRPIRAGARDALHFGAPWSEQTTARWLDRFAPESAP
jgi:hypothetical protein